MEYTRQDLVDLCEAGIVPESKWHDRDSAGAVRQLGECAALLRAGCAFVVRQNLSGHCNTDDRTIWVDVTFQGFMAHDGGEAETEMFYIPTQARLDAAAGRDWY